MTFSEFPQNGRMPTRAARAFAPGLALAIVAALMLVFAGSAQAKYTTFALVAPKNGAKVKGKIAMTAALQKDLQRRAWGVEFWIDSERVGVDRKAPFSMKVNTAKFENGQHQFRISLLVKSKGKKTPDPKVCEFLRSVYAYVSNKPKARKAVSTAPKIPTPIASSKQWRLTFDDEFNGTSLDSSKWTAQREDWLPGGSTYNNREGAPYLAKNVTVAGGSLIQTIRKEPFENASYTTGMVNTNHRFSFQYGYVEARVKVPSCNGCWPTWWTLPTGETWPPEFDLFEYIDTSGLIRRPFVASHWKDSPEAVLQTQLDYYTQPCGTATDYTGQYHTYGFLWTPTKIQPYLDGVAGPTFTGAAVAHSPMYLIMMLGVLDIGQPTDGANMATDFVRVWQLPGSPVGQ
jgi:beta-glucanase (GH16 family)